MSRVLARWLAAAAIIPSCLAFGRLARADDAASAPVHVETNVPGAGVYVRTDSIEMVPVPNRRRSIDYARAYSYDPICKTAPCASALGVGTHTLALTLPEGDILEGPSPVTISGPSDVKATLVDRSTWRAVGTLTLIGTAIATAIILVDAKEPPAPPYCTAVGTCYPQNHAMFDSTGAGVAIGVGLVGTVASLVMIGQSDKLTFTVTPLTIGALPGRRESGLESAIPNGLAFSARF